jgi:hypothetical protein
MLWSTADHGEKILKRALSLLFHRNDNLLHFILNPDYPRLRAPSDVIKEQARSFSSSEQILIQIGLDIWDGSGGIHFNDLYENLDQRNFQKVLLVLNYLYSPEEAILF